MSAHERKFGNVMLGVIAGLALWTLTGSLFQMLFRDDLSLIGHLGARAAMYEYDGYGDTGF